MKIERALTDPVLRKIDHGWILAQLLAHGDDVLKRKLKAKVPDDLRVKDTNSPLAVRCLPSGARSYVVHSTVSGGENRLYTWKGAPDASYKELKAWALREHADMLSGVDRRAKHKAVVAANEVEQITVRQALDDYRSNGNGSPKTKHDNIRRIETYMPRWLSRPMLSITKADVKNLWGENGEALLAAVVTHQAKAKVEGNGGHFTDGKVQANATMRSFTTIWNEFASTYEGNIPQSPVRRAGLKMHEIVRKDRLWTNDTTRALFEAEVAARTAAFYKLLAYTGLRGIELRCLEWKPVPKTEVVGGERGAWVEDDRLVFAPLFVKARKAKRGAFYLPLTKETRGIIKVLRELPDAHDQWVFPATGAKMSESGHIESVGWLADELHEAGVKWTGGTHSTRHWHRDVLRELRYLESEQDAAHNQSTQGMSSVYGVRLKPEAHRVMMERVAKYISRVVAGKKDPAEGISFLFFRVASPSLCL